MLPTDLAASSFAGYPPQARILATSNLAVLRQMPLAFLPSLLQEVIEYDYKFPAERAELDAHFARVSALTPAELKNLLQGFWQLKLSAEQEKVDWVNQPQRFTEQFSAYLWSTHQMDTFRAAATHFGQDLQAQPTPQAQQQRLGISIVGRGSRSDTHVFEKLRPLGTCFTNVNPADGLQKLLSATAARAETHPAAYAHWYVDGGEPHRCSAQVKQVSYAALDPVRNILLGKIQQQVSIPGMGPERLRDYLAQLRPEELGLSSDPVLDRFKMRVLTEGSGTQIYSTTFAQWTAREVLRRSQPQTLLVRFAPRQRQRSMSELLASAGQESEVDPAGSLIDADMATYYHWINQQRLPGHERSAFVAWFEDHQQAVIIGPSVTRGATSASFLDMAELVALATA